MIKAHNRHSHTVQTGRVVITQKTGPTWVQQASLAASQSSSGGCFTLTGVHTNCGEGIPTPLDLHFIACCCKLEPPNATCTAHAHSSTLRLSVLCSYRAQGDDPESVREASREPRRRGGSCDDQRTPSRPACSCLLSGPCLLLWN